MTAVEEATALYRKARDHKRASGHHRNEARRTMEQLEQFCRQSGISFQTITKGEGENHGQSDSQSLH